MKKANKTQNQHSRTNFNTMFNLPQNEVVGALMMERERLRKHSSMSNEETMNYLFEIHSSPQLMQNFIDKQLRK